MPSTSIQEKLIALYRVSSEQLTDFFKSGTFDDFAIKINEFQVFCAFWVTACYLRSTDKPVKEQVENFNKSIIVSIVDGIIASHPEDLKQDQINSINETITKVFIERFGSYRENFEADLGQREIGRVYRFPCLVETFLASTLDKSVDETSPMRQLLDVSLENLLRKSQSFFSTQNNRL